MGNRGRIFLLVSFMSVVLIAVGIFGLHGMESARDGLETVYKDSVMPLKYIKTISDMYGTIIVDTTHKVRSGNLTWLQGMENIDTAVKTINKNWNAYKNTNLLPEEKHLISIIEPLMKAEYSSIAKLTDILKKEDKSAISEYAGNNLYPVIDVILIKLDELGNIQLNIAKSEYDKTRIVYDRSRKIAIGSIIIGLLFAAMGTIWIVSSITDPLNKEIAIRKLTEKSLRESEIRFRSIFNGTPDAMFIIDQDTDVIVDSNPSASSLLMKPKEEIIGMSQIRLHPQSVEGSSTRTFQWHLKEARHDVPTNPIENKIIRDDGTCVWVEAMAQLITLENKDYILGVFRDVTMRKEMQDRLIQTEKMASFGRLAARIVHEINNPLTNVSMKIHNLKYKITQLSLDETIIAKLEGIEESIDKVSSITKELLLTFRSETTDFMPVNLNDAIKGAVTLLEHRLEGITIHYDLESVPEIMGDLVDLEHVFVNILDNAIYALSNKGDIFIDTSFDGNMVVSGITDTGTGIMEEYLKKVFDPFFTTKEIGTGTGLGLSICYGIISQHNGTIDVKSSLGKGTKVTVKIPVKFR